MTLGLLLGGLLLGVVACAEPDDDAGGVTTPARPHLVLVSIDTLRADRLGCYGDPRGTSPRLDALADSAWLFEQMRANSTSTAPSHMTLMTGVLPAVHQVRNEADHGLSPGLPTLAEQLANEGWHTVAFADGGHVNAQLGFARGFDVFDSRYEPLADKLPRVEAWLDEADRSEPTFLFLHTYGVHAPYLPGAEHDTFGDPAYDGELDARVASLRQVFHAGEDDLALLSERFWHASGQWDAADRARVSSLYDGAIHDVDSRLGALFERLERDGWLDDAWLVITSDHGEAFYEHGAWEHRTLHDEIMAVPLIVRPPGGLASGRRVTASTSLVDLAPTLLDVLGLSAPSHMQGRSLLPFESAQPRAVLASGGERLRLSGVVHQGRKLIGTEQRLRMAYDLDADPLELDDLLGVDRESPDWAAELAQALDAMRAEAAALRAQVGEPGEAGALSPEQLQALQALGYLR